MRVSGNAERRMTAMPFRKSLPQFANRSHDGHAQIAQA
jgi:hypothetical protein